MTRKWPFFRASGMRFLFGALALAALATSCMPTDSGIEGYITSGPTCPVGRPGQSCPDRPYAGTLTVLTEVGGRRVGGVTADDTGFYRIALAPGRYVVRPESPAVLPRAGEVSVSVEAHRFTRQDILYDTGIR